MSAVDTYRVALFGSPPDPNYTPSREGSLAAFQELQDTVGSVAAGWVPYETVALMDADLSKAEGTLGFVYYNNGDTDDAANTFYQFRDGAWEIADWVFNLIEDLVQSIVDTAMSPLMVFNDPTDGCATLGGPLSSPNTRYDFTVDSNGYLVLTSTFANAYPSGWRSNIGRRPGRIYRVIASFSATGYNSATTGVGIGFDTARQTGVDAALSANNVWIVWRNGLLLVERFSAAGSVSTPTGYTISPGSTESFAQTDIVKLEIEENLDESAVIRRYKNGTLVATDTLSWMPQGVFNGGVRLPSTGVGSVLLMQAVDTEVTQEIDNAVNVGAGNAIIPAQPVGMARALLGNATLDVTALTVQRVVPPGFPSYIPMLPVIVRSVGDVTVSNTAVGAFLLRYPTVATGSIAYVDSVNGNNGTGVLDDPDAPYQTINYALQSTVATIIVLENGVHEPWRYEYDDSSNRAKLIIARNRGLATIRNSGDDISTLTWTNTGDNVWKTTLTGVDIYDVTRILYTDTYDDYGFPARLRRYSYVTGQTNLRATSLGFTYNTGTKELYVGLGGVSVEANKTRIRALYSVVSQSNAARCFAQGCRIAMDGVNLEGVSILGYEFDDGGTKRSPEIFISNLVSFCAWQFACNLQQGGMIVSENVRVHASEFDGYNCNWGSAGAEALMNIVGGWGTLCGDTTTYDADGTANRQFISAHAGYLVAIGNVAQDNYGQEYADVSSSTPGVPSLSWYVGCMANGANVLEGTTGTTIAWQIDGSGASGSDRRTAWIDSCANVSGYDYALVISGGSTVYSFNNNFTGSLDGTPVAYTPDNP